MKTYITLKQTLNSDNYQHFCSHQDVDIAIYLYGGVSILVRLWPKQNTRNPLWKKASYYQSKLVFFKDSANFSYPQREKGNRVRPQSVLDILVCANVE